METTSLTNKLVPLPTVVVLGPGRHGRHEDTKQNGQLLSREDRQYRGSELDLF